MTATASTALFARLIQAESETRYRKVSTSWLDREPPAGWMPVSVWHSRNETHLPRAFIAWKKDKTIAETEIALVGDLEAALERQLPREMCKLVLARHFHESLGDRTRNLPVSIRIGTPIVETLPAQEQAHQFERFLVFQAGGKMRRLSDLFALTDPFTEDRNEVLAQGYAVTRFLLTRGTRPQFLRFVESGVKGDWNTAAKEVYDYKSLDAMEQAFLVWVKTPESRPVPKR